MLPAERRPLFFTLAAGALLLVFLLECFSSSRIKSPAWDETGDIAAGVSYLLTDRFTVNLQHPPLLKELIGLSTLASGARWPNTPEAQRLLAGDSQFQWTVGDQIILANGPDGLRQTTEDAVLNANYIRKGLEGTYDLPYSTPSMHEVVFSDKIQAKKGVKTMDLAKRLIDYGFHPYTTAFPLIVPGAMMIEPTESESKEEMDLLIESMKSIAEEVEEDPQMVQSAPHATRVSRLDETAAARKPVLRWKPAN